MKKTLIPFLFLVLVASCDNQDSEVSSDAVEQQVTSVSVVCQQRKSAPGIETVNDDGSSIETDDAPIIINSFENGSLLYFSQMGPSGTPNFTNFEASASPYLYIYEYQKNAEANWNNEYNFSVQQNRLPLDWTTVKEIGSFGNAFSMYAFYFPVGNTVRFNVETDQRDLDAFKKSDIMGAYHATSSLYTRLRFRLFHLMVYLKVTLYVPVFDGETSEDYTDIHYSGFLRNAVQGAYVMNAQTGFNIEWRANKSSDTEAPLTQIENKVSKNITMYTHPSDEEDKTMCIKVSNYYNDKENVSGVCKHKDGHSCDVCDCEALSECGCDEVRVYNFSVLFPAQTFGDNFLCFAVKKPDDAIKYYYFSGSQIVGDQGNYSLTQGTLQQLYLYLPRKTNETILIGAKILPWYDAVTDMTVTKKESSAEGQSK